MTGKTSVGFLGPQPYMAQAIEKLSETYDVHELNPEGWSAPRMDAIAEVCREKGIEAVAGYAQKDAFHHILINERLGNVAPRRQAFLYCMNKYLMRTLEADPFWFIAIDPSVESDDEIIERVAEWPFMLKNTSLSLGRGIYKIKDADSLRSVLADYRADTALQANIAADNAAYTADMEDELPPSIPPFIGEHMVDMQTCIEYCYEGYITADGEIVHYALTEEVYFSNHAALGYITPPISITTEKADQIEAWVEDYMGRMRDLGYVGQFFNLEFWIMQDGTIALTEINPRAAHSYHYNYEYSFGASLYGDNLELARTGAKLPGRTPWQMWRDGETRCFTLIALITSTVTGALTDIIDYDYVRELEEAGVLIRHTRAEGDTLTDADMTAAGAMVMQMWLTGDTQSDVIAREREIRSKIYRQAPEGLEYPDYWVAD
ncbi:MAG: ATP-grasp domain-containing protein [Mobilicoccus sp.]|nr:ATP-grasp domain-containing protein [Mobilicoccus sp.]